MIWEDLMRYLVIAMALLAVAGPAFAGDLRKENSFTETA
jgi:hypothetical protein